MEQQFLKANSKISLINTYAAPFSTRPAPGEWGHLVLPGIHELACFSLFYFLPAFVTPTGVGSSLTGWELAELAGNFSS